MAGMEFDSPDLAKFIETAFPDATPGLLAALLAGQPGMFDTSRRPVPQLHPVPESTRGFRLRVDLLRTKPPIWRRIDVPGDITLPQLHDVIQAAMGWTDSHLHCFRTGNERNSPEFLTQFALEEGDEGMAEDGVRLDQVVADEGDRLWYDYDFGDGWDHVLRVEKVLDVPPSAPTCLTGKLACPPEDCGGVWGYQDLAAWVRSGYDDALRPEAFDSDAEGLAWLGEEWHPDVFDLAETNDQIALVTAEPADLAEEFGGENPPQ